MGGSKGGSNVTIGYRYYMGMQMGLCRGPIDEICEIRIGDLTAFPWAHGSYTFFDTIWVPGNPDNPYSPTITGSGAYQILASQIFGGDKKEGGVIGTFHVFMGDETQEYAAWIKSKLGGLVPDFRGVVTAYFDGMICSLNPYPKKWKIRHRRTMRGWDGPVWQPDLATIWMAGGKVKAMNPAHILYECSTNRDWGRGLPRTMIDEVSWSAAAQTLFNEGFGLCMRWTRRDTLDEFAQNVVNHIGGSIFIDRETGLLTLKLIRGDYDPATLPLFDYDSGLLSIDSGETAARDNAINEIVVKFHDPISDEDREVRAHNLASIQSLGSVNNNSISYPGLPTAELAARVAQRDLRAGTASIRRYKVVLDRRAWRIYPGAVFRVTALDRGISSLILRAGKVSEPSLTDGKITVDAVVDVFGLPSVAFVDPQEPTWEAPDSTPPIITHRKVREATYRDLYLRLSSLELNDLDVSATAIATMAVKPSSLSLNYAIATRTASEPFVARNTDTFSPATILGEDIDAYDTLIPFSTGFELGLVEVNDLVQIDDEIIQLVDIDVDADNSGVMTVKRGCVDTVPTAHLAGAVAFILSDPIGTDGREYSSGETVDVKMLTTTSTDTLNEAIPPVNSVITVGRQGRPYPPGNVRVNGTRCHDVTAVTGEMIISWVHRNRVTQADQIVAHFDGSVAPEAGTTYTVRVYSASNTLLAQQTGISGTSYTVPEELTGALKFELESSRSSLSSAQKHVFSLLRS